MSKSYKLWATFEIEEIDEDAGTYRNVYKSQDCELPTPIMESEHFGPVLEHLRLVEKHAAGWLFVEPEPRICADCGSSDLHYAVWIRTDTGLAAPGDGPFDYHYCPECGGDEADTIEPGDDPVEYAAAQAKHSAKVIAELHRSF
jgi:hypothetical protein